VAIIVFQYLGLPILYFQLDDYRAEFVTDRNVIQNVWLITSVTTILLSLGASAARLVTGAKIYLNEPADDFQEDRSWSLRRLILLSALSIFVLYIYVSKVGLGNLAIAAVAIQASGEAITLARSQMGNAFDGGYHWYNFFMRDALMFSVLAFFAVRRKSAGKIIKTVSVLLFFALVFSLTMAAEKGLFADFILALMIVFALKHDRGYLRLSHLLR